MMKFATKAFPNMHYVLNPALMVSRVSSFCSKKYFSERTATNYDNDDNAAFYKQLKKDYNWFFSPFSDTMINQLQLLKSNKRNLDIACGDGNVSS